jgi:hypothetical protein
VPTVALVPLEELPRIDEHSILVAAPPDRVWQAVHDTLRALFASPAARLAARLLGCDPAGTAGWDLPVVGASIPGFRLVADDRPWLVVVAGRHRFSRYGIVFRIGAAPGGTVCRAESRAAFPGPHGAAYRLAVVGSGGHVLAVRRLLRAVRAAAEPGPP